MARAMDPGTNFAGHGGRSQASAIAQNAAMEKPARGGFFRAFFFICRARGG